MKLPVGLFGKLRLFADFIEPIHRVGFGGDLRDWLSTAANSPDLALDARRTFHAAWPVRGGKEIIAAVLWGSSDSVGRTCPFALFCQIPVRKLKVRSIADLPLSVAPIWRCLEEISTTADGCAWVDLGEDQATALHIQNAVKRARVLYRPDRHLARDFDQNLVEWPATDFLEMLFSPAFWVHAPRVAWCLADVARDLTMDDDPTLALRLPVSDGLPPAFQCATWLRVLESLSGGRLKKMPTLVLPAGRARVEGQLILFRDLIPRDASVLFGNDVTHDYLSDLRRPDPPAPDSTERARFDAFTAQMQERLVPAFNALDYTRLPLDEMKREAERAVL